MALFGEAPAKAPASTGVVVYMAGRCRLCCGQQMVQMIGRCKPPNGA